MTNDEIENRIARVNATMAMEGMPLSEDEKNVIRDILLGKVSCDEVIKELVEKYSKKSNSA